MKKRNIRKFQLILITSLIALLLLFSTACGGQAITEEPGQADPDPSPGTEAQLKIGFVTAAGGVGDESLTDMVFGGIQQAAETLGAQLDYVEPMESADFTPMFQNFADDGTYDIIIGVGYECSEPINQLAPLYPDQKWLAVDTPVEIRDNTASITFNRSEQGFIPGLVFAHLATADTIIVDGETINLSDSNGTIGCIIGTDASTIIESQAGLFGAVKYTNPDVNILTGTVGSWTDSATANEIATSMFDQGVNFIWQNAGNGGRGIFRAAKDHDGYSQGWNTPQHELDPEHILFSVVKATGNVTRDWLIDWAETGEFIPQNNYYGYATDGYELQFSPLYEPDPDILESVEKGLEDLKAGNIISPLTMEEVDDFLED